MGTPVQSLSFRAISAGSFADLLQPRERTVKGVSNTCHHGGAKPDGCRHPLTAALALSARSIACWVWPQALLRSGTGGVSVPLAVRATGPTTKVARVSRAIGRGGGVLAR